MATTFTLVTPCPVSAQRMFDVSLLIDVQEGSMRASGGRAVAGVTSGPIALGETVTWQARHFGVWFRHTSVISDLVRPDRFTDEQVRGPFGAYRHRHYFVDASGGSRMIDEVTLASPVFGALAERLVLVPYLRLLIRRRNAALLEAAAARTRG